MTLRNDGAERISRQPDITGTSERQDARSDVSLVDLGRGTQVSHVECVEVVVFRRAEQDGRLQRVEYELVHAHLCTATCLWSALPDPRESWAIMATLPERGTDLHGHTPECLSAPQIVQAHGPITATAREHARLTLVEGDADDVFAGRRRRRRVELEGRERSRLGLVPDFNVGRTGRKDGVVAVMGDGAARTYPEKGSIRAPRMRKVPTKETLT